MENQLELQLKESLSFLERGNPLEAQKIISSLFEQDLEDERIVYTSRCCVFWIDTLARLNKIEDPSERVENMLLEWKTFQSFISRDEFSYEPAFYAFQKGFFSAALSECLALVDEKDSLQRAEMYRKAGICYKKLGDFENALNCLKEANITYPKLASVLAELGDCYSLCGEDRIGKVLFREAFFINPENIDLDFLDSELIKCLIKKTREKGYTGKALLYWIPVYGLLSGILNVKKELSPQEVGRLKKNIYAMENEFKDPSFSGEILVPHLLNSYFWLIDHYILARENPAKINEVLIKMKILDSSIYQAYIK